MNNNDLIGIIEAAGGQIVENENDCNIFISDMKGNTKKNKTLALSSAWILDSISQWKLPKPDNYQINIESDDKTEK